MGRARTPNTPDGRDRAAGTDVAGPVGETDAPREPDEHERERRDRRAEQWQERFHLPVIIAALASVPAIFLTQFEGWLEQLGNAVNYASLAVFVSESVVLFALSGHRLRWLRDHWWMVVLALATVPAVLFAAGPVQVLRLLRFVRVIGAIRIIRVGRIFKAGRILHGRLGKGGWLSALIIGVMSVAAAAFVGIVLADPDAEARRFLDGALERFGFAPVVLAGLILAGATYIVYRYRAKGPDGDATDTDATTPPRPPPAGPPSHDTPDDPTR